MSCIRRHETGAFTTRSGRRRRRKSRGYVQQSVIMQTHQNYPGSSGGVNGGEGMNGFVLCNNGHTLIKFLDVSNLFPRNSNLFLKKEHVTQKEESFAPRISVNRQQAESGKGWKLKHTDKKSKTGAHDSSVVTDNTYNVPPYTPLYTQS